MIEINNAELNTSILSGATTFFSDFSGVIALVFGVAVALAVISLIFSFFDIKEEDEYN